MHSISTFRDMFLEKYFQPLKIKNLSYLLVWFLLLSGTLFRKNIYALFSTVYKPAASASSSSTNSSSSNSNASCCVPWHIQTGAKDNRWSGVGPSSLRAAKCLGERYPLFDARSY